MPEPVPACASVRVEMLYTGSEFGAIETTSPKA